MKGFLLVEIGVPKGEQEVMKRQDVDNNLKDNKKLMFLADSRLTFRVVCYKNQTSKKMEAWRQRNLGNAQLLTRAKGILSRIIRVCL